MKALTLHSTRKDIQKQLTSSVSPPFHCLVPSQAELDQLLGELPMDAFVAELFLLDKSLPREKWCQSRRKNFLPISYFRSGMLCALNKHQRKISDDAQEKSFLLVFLSFWRRAVSCWPFIFLVIFWCRFLHSHLLIIHNKVEYIQFLIVFKDYCYFAASCYFSLLMRQYHKKIHLILEFKPRYLFYRQWGSNSNK